MSSRLDRDTAFARAYRTIRRLPFVPGQRIRVDELAHRVRLSATPIREILSRLVGEGLIEERRGEGYFAPRPGASEVAELYILLQAVGIALLGRPSTPVPHEPTPDPLTISACLALLAGRHDGSLLARELLRVDALMHPLRPAEAASMSMLADHVRAIWDTMKRGDAVAHIAAFSAYCDDGRAAAHLIADMIARSTHRI